MLRVPASFSQDEDLLQLVAAPVFTKVREVMAKFWLSPQEMKALIEELLASSGHDSSLKVVVSGETKNVSLYLIGSTGVLVAVPFGSIENNVLLREIYQQDSLPRNCTQYVFPAEAPLLRRLALPKVLLVNPCVLENFPIPRLCLSIGLLASYLRKFQVADVRLIDMQVGATIEDILQEARSFQPNLLGISISYGQKYLAMSLLDKLYQAKQSGSIHPLVVVGNIIPASFPREFIDSYADLVVVCGEGEDSIVGLIEHLRDGRALDTIPGIAYRDASGKLQRTLNKSVSMENIPLPALDTIKDIARCRGAVTIELSRGCQWNVCTFCPREHKSNHWKTFGKQQILEQFSYLREVCDRFHIKKHIYLADEEFLGGINDGMETERVAEIARSLIRDRVDMQFDAAARVDQVYDPHMDRQWHIKRMEMWHLTRKAGLERLFMGVESGCDEQLKRYGKGIKAEHSIFAIRILSALGIPLRFGFITFDQLMIGLKDLKENIAFLERTDAFMKPIDVEAYGYERLFDLLTQDQDFVHAHAANKPVFAGVSYMLASMEVLINSRYKVLLQHAENRYGKRLVLNEDAPDTNMGRYTVDFVDDLVKDISVSSQKWIDRHFGLSYAIKSLYKVAPPHEGHHLMSWMIAYRQISLNLAKALVYLFDEAAEADQHPLQLTGSYSDSAFMERIAALRLRAQSNHYRRTDLIEECMNMFDQLVEQENRKIRALLQTGGITDASDGSVSQVLRRWYENKGRWALINDPDKVAECF